MRQVPIIQVAIEVRDEHKRGTLAAALQELANSGTSLHVTTDAESEQSLLAGMSEEQLNAAIVHLTKLMGAAFVVGKPQAIYRETLRKSVTIDYTHKEQLGGAGRYARVKISFDPLPSGTGFVVQNTIVGGTLPTEFIAGVVKGLCDVKENGLLAGFPVTDFRATLVDGEYHDVDSSPLAFELAARGAFEELAKHGSAVLTEPIMAVDITVRSGFLDIVRGNVAARRVRDMEVAPLGENSRITAVAPLANLAGFKDQLRSITKDQGACELRFSHYEPVANPDDDPDTFPSAAALRIGARLA